MPGQNPLDRMAEELAEWADVVSTQVANSIKGGFNAPGAAQLSERQKLEFYTHQTFNPDGTPNTAGRARLLDRLGAAGFAEVYDDVLRAHPELAPPPEEPFAAGYRVPTEQPGVFEVTHSLPATQPTGVPGVEEVVG